MDLKELKIERSQTVTEYPPQDELCPECGRERSLHNRYGDHKTYISGRYYGPQLPCGNYSPCRRLDKPHFMVAFRGTALIETIDCLAPLMFGKYKGQKLEDVPVHYLNWLINQYLKDVVRYSTEIQRRKVMGRITGEKDSLFGTI